MNDNELTPEVQATIAEIRRAKPKPAYKLTALGYKRARAVAARDFKALKPVLPALDDLISDTDEPLHERDIKPLIAKLSSLKPVAYTDNDGDYDFSVASVEKAVPMPSITFSYDDNEGTLLADGTLTLGCQSHPLSTWARATGGDGSPLQGYFSSFDSWGEGQRRIAARNAIVPVLREKLRELKALRKAAA
jgi:hypothetical protein